MPIKTATPVTLPLSALTSSTIPHSTLLSAFGPDSLGILVVSDLPSSFSTLRSRVLKSASQLASLPTETLSSLTSPTSKYLVGWSHGVETLRPGVVDTGKGSYYVNCAFYKAKTLQGADGEKHPGFEEYTAPNIWLDEEDMPGFRDGLEDLVKLVIDTAVLVARQCDKFAEKEVEGYERGYLEKVVKGSETTKARLLHYFPSEVKETEEKSEGSEDGGSDVSDDWCATHLDHGCLTGLTSAMYIDESRDGLEELESSPSPGAGLYIKARNGEVYKVAIPRDCLAFQTGEALELITQGRFKAVPHFVKGVDSSELTGEKAGMRVARNTLAVFTQPNLDEVVDSRNGLTFGEFAHGIVKKNTAG